MILNKIFAFLLGLNIAIATASLQAEESPKIDPLKSLADMLNLDISDLSFQDENKNPITAKQFVSFVEQKRTFSIAKHESAATLTINALQQNIDSQANALNSKPTVTKLPDFNLPATSKKNIQIADLKGKPTLLSFYFSTCSPCIAEVPMLNQLKEKYESDYNFLAVTFDDMETSDEFNKEFNYEWTSLVSAEAFIKELGVKVYPTFILFDAEGNAVDSLVGYSKENTLESMSDWLRSATSNSMDVSMN